MVRGAAGAGTVVVVLPDHAAGDVSRPAHAGLQETVVAEAQVYSHWASLLPLLARFSAVSVLRAGS